MEIASIVLSSVSVVLALGGLGYAVKSGKALEAESQRLRRHTSMLLRALDSAGLISVRFENGEPMGVIHSGEARLEAHSSIEVEPDDDEPQDH